jgi:UDP-N-acetylglucosamine 3-dehydrogenase
MNKDKLRAAVVGLGNMGRHHVRNYHEMEDVELVAVCDSGQDRVDEFSCKFNCNPYTDLSTMLSEQAIDVVSLAAPTSLHYRLAKDILQAGCHVLIEKPIAESVKEADELTQIANDLNRVLAVGHIERFNPAVVALKGVLDSGELGQVNSLVLQRCGPMPMQIRDANVVIDLAVHDIDIATMLVGTPPLSVAAHAGQSQLQDRHDHAEILLKFPSSSAMIQVNWITPKRVRKLSLTGSKGYAELDFIGQTVEVFFPNNTSRSVPVGEVEPLRSELRHFLAAVRGHDDLLISSSVGRDALALALDVLAAV